jgi:hypothetical protein
MTGPGPACAGVAPRMLPHGPSAAPRADRREPTIATDRPGADGPLPRALADADPAARARYRRARRLAHLLDSQFDLPVLNRSVGIDAVLGFVPVIGGAVGLALSTIVIGHGLALGVRGATLVRMLGNAAVDAVISSIPGLGGVATALFKANERNVRLMTSHALDPDAVRADSRRQLLVVAVVAIAIAVVVIAAAVALIGWLVSLVI